MGIFKYSLPSGHPRPPAIRLIVSEYGGWQGVVDDFYTLS